MNRKQRNRDSRSNRDRCICGAALPSRWFHDARGIELFRGCDVCAPAKMKSYRPEVLTDPNYHADEPIEEE